MYILETHTYIDLTMWIKIPQQFTKYWMTRKTNIFYKQNIRIPDNVFLMPVD